jgi:two-component system sensor histidine kinase KdpD
MELLPHNKWLWLALQWVVATSITIGLTAVLLMTHANASTSGIAYLVVVVMYSTLAGRWLSIYLAICSALLFDYFFFPPYRSLMISRPGDWISFLAFVGSCIVVGRVAERARRETRQAEQRREDVEQLFTLSQEMMLHDDAKGLVRDIPRLVERVFGLEAVLLYVSDGDQVYSSVPGHSSVEANHEFDGTTHGAPHLDREIGNAMHRALREATEMEVSPRLPEGYAPIRLTFGMHSVGMLAWKPASLSLEVATSVAAQVAIAITRAHAIGLSTRLEAARSADRLRSALIDSLTHELRTPLTAIRAAATTLADGKGVDEAMRTELVSIVDEESVRLDDLIGEAMEMAEIEAGSFRVNVEPVRVRAFLENVAEKLRPVLNGYRLMIMDEQAEPTLNFDPHLLERVLHHLLENAAGYSKAGSRVWLRVKQLGSRLEFEVEDEGAGIDSHDLPHIFDKFYRGRRQGSTVKGSGMGLAIVRAIVTAHGGAIEARSTVGKGSLFRVWLPAMTKVPVAVQRHES